jgi:hypothetical protein
MAADLLTTIRSELDARLGELRPLLAEYERLLAAVDALATTTSGRTTSGTSASGTESAATPKLAPSGSAAAQTSVSPAPAPRKRGRPRGSAAGAIKRAASTPSARTSAAEAASGSEADGPSREKPKRRTAAKSPRAPRGAAKLAIIAALEHGSHTVSELAVVTAMSGPNISGNIRRLLQERAITKTSREGKTAYALLGTAAGGSAED